MTDVQGNEFARIYAGFQSPICALDCGEKCAPYNENRVPFCCDSRQAVPSADEAEWAYLSASTDWWHEWQAADPVETARLQKQRPAGHTLIECNALSAGHSLCPRAFRSLTCRAFPFFPYIDREGQFLGLSYYWEYRDRCWIISHLGAVSDVYRQEFVGAFEALFTIRRQEYENFRYHGQMMRRVYGRRRQAIPLLHRDGGVYKITPSNGRMRRVRVEHLPKFGPYKIADVLRFADEK